MERINGYYGIRVPCARTTRDPDGVRDWWWKAPSSALDPVWAFPEWIAMLHRNAGRRVELMATPWTSSKESRKADYEQYLSGTLLAWPSSARRGPLADKRAITHDGASMWAYLWEMEEDLVSIYHRGSPGASKLRACVLDAKYQKNLGLAPVFTLPRTLFASEDTAKIVAVATQQNARRIKASDTAFDVVGNYLRGELPRNDASMEPLSEQDIEAAGFMMCVGRHFELEHHPYALNSLSYLPANRRPYVRRCLINLLSCSRVRHDFARELFLFVELCQWTPEQMGRALKLLDDQIDLAKALFAWFDMEGGDPAELLRLIAALRLTPEQLNTARDRRADMQVTVA